MVSSFDMAAQRFTEHKYPTIILGSYDTYRYGQPDGHKVEKIPSIVLYPAKEKDKLVSYEAMQHKTRWLMEFIQENASLKFELSERAHLPTRMARVGDPDLITEDL